MSRPIILVPDLSAVFLASETAGPTFIVVLILESCGSSGGTEASSILVADEGRCQVLSIDLRHLVDERVRISSGKFFFLSVMLDAL